MDPAGERELARGAEAVGQIEVDDVGLGVDIVDLDVRGGPPRLLDVAHPSMVEPCHP
jgi:hypothetical protein